MRNSTKRLSLLIFGCCTKMVTLCVRTLLVQKQNNNNNKQQPNPIAHIHNVWMLRSNQPDPLTACICVRQFVYNLYSFNYSAHYPIYYQQHSNSTNVSVVVVSLYIFPMHWLLITYLLNIQNTYNIFLFILFIKKNAHQIHTWTGHAYSAITRTTPNKTNNQKILYFFKAGMAINKWVKRWRSWRENKKECEKERERANKTRRRKKWIKNNNEMIIN